MQLVGVELEQHAAADADAAVVKGHPAAGQRVGQRFFQCHAALFFGQPFGFFLLQGLAQFQLDADHPHQQQHQNAHQGGHQIREDGPDRRGLGIAVV